KFSGLTDSANRPLDVVVHGHSNALDRGFKGTSERPWWGRNRGCPRNCIRLIFRPNATGLSSREGGRKKGREPGDLPRTGLRLLGRGVPRGCGQRQPAAATASDSPLG